MRTFRIVLGLSTLLWSFAQAPFLHLHADDHDRDHNAVTHSHLRLAHTSHGPTITEAEEVEHTIDLVWSVSTPTAIHLNFDLAVVDKLVVPAPLLAGAAISPLNLHSHDPPSLRPQNPRGPPA